MDDKIICIFDFPGNNKYQGAWADFNESTNTVLFGGAWDNIEPWETKCEPTEIDVFNYVMDSVGATYEMETDKIYEIVFNKKEINQ